MGPAPDPARLIRRTTEAVYRMIDG